MLLDVNVLLALGWPNHQCHGAAVEWFAGLAEWSTCAVTELGFIRLSCHPAYSAAPRTPAEAAEYLQQLAQYGCHRYLAEGPRPSNVPFWGRVAGPKQVTDAYLVAVAQHHGTHLATFDARLARSNPGAPVVVLPRA